jgi:hypothetical protein
MYWNQCCAPRQNKVVLEVISDFCAIPPPVLAAVPVRSVPDYLSRPGPCPPCAQECPQSNPSSDQVEHWKK